MREVNFLIEGSRLFNERQNKELEKAKSKNSVHNKKFEVNSISQLSNLPGVKKIKKKK